MAMLMFGKAQKSEETATIANIREALRELAKNRKNRRNTMGPISTEGEEIIQKYQAMRICIKSNSPLKETGDFADA